MTKPRQPKTLPVRWSPAEDERLREHYPTGGTAGCMAVLPGRNAHAISDRAIRLGVHAATRSAPTEAWTPAEDAILRNLYPDGGPLACVPFLPQRTRKAITQHACLLGVTYLKWPWSPAEDAILRTHYPAGGQFACAPLLTHRTDKAIRHRATVLRLLMSEETWTPAEDAILRTHYPTGGVLACAPLLPQRSPRRIGQRARKLRVRVKRVNARIWTPAEEAILREHCPRVGALGCMPYLPQRTPNAIHSKAVKLRLRIGRQARRESEVLVEDPQRDRAAPAVWSASW